MPAIRFELLLLPLAPVAPVAAATPLPSLSPSESVPLLDDDVPLLWPFAECSAANRLCINACSAACTLCVELEVEVAAEVELEAEDALDAEVADDVLALPSDCPNACMIDCIRLEPLPVCPVRPAPPLPSLSPSVSAPPADWVDFVVCCKKDRLLKLEILLIELMTILLNCELKQNKHLD
jgi:hypothetical protein